MGVANLLVREYSSLDLRFSSALGKSMRRITLNIPGAGCEYQKKTGGCMMCGFHVATNKYSRGKLLPVWIFQLLSILAWKFYAKEKPSELFVYNGGSFWNDREIPRAFQRWLFGYIAFQKSIQRVMVESRCEYITGEKIKEAVTFLGGKELLVGIGLESSNDYLRNIIIKKGLTRKDFERTVKLINDNGARVAAYIFLKPLGLTDEEALEDVISTIKYALSVGVFEINVSCAFIQEKTEMAKAYLAGKFVPPKLNVVVDLISSAKSNNLPVNIGGFDDYPPPIDIPKNCENCSPSFYDLIENFRKNGVLGEIPQCNCRAI